MKKILFLLLLTSSIIYSQKNDYNVKKGAAVNGYDVVAYFSNKAIKGNKKFTTTYDGVKFRFATLENLTSFKGSPTMYIPQYGGFCAYAIAENGKKVGVDPKTFEIRDGKLYLFYNSWGMNTLKSWKKKGAEKLKEKADKNWKKIISEN